MTYSMLVRRGKLHVTYANKCMHCLSLWNLIFTHYSRTKLLIFVGGFCSRSGAWVRMGHGPQCQGCAAGLGLLFGSSAFCKGLLPKSHTWPFCVWKGLVFVFNTLKKKSLSFHLSKPYVFYLLIAQNVSTMLFYIKAIFILAWILSRGIWASLQCTGEQLQGRFVQVYLKPGHGGSWTPPHFSLYPALKNNDTSSSIALHCQKIWCTDTKVLCARNANFQRWYVWQDGLNASYNTGKHEPLKEAHLNSF